MNKREKSIKNRRAQFEFFLLQTFNAGIVLTGTEIKSVREGKVNLKDAFCQIHEGELWVKNMHISHYKFASYNNHITTRERKLLLKKREIKKIASKLKEKGLTVVPVQMYISERGYAKLDISLAKGKKFFDKRDTIKQKDNKRELDRVMKDYR